MVVGCEYLSKDSAHPQRAPSYNLQYALLPAAEPKDQQQSTYQ